MCVKEQIEFMPGGKIGSSAMLYILLLPLALKNNWLQFTAQTLWLNWPTHAAPSTLQSSKHHMSLVLRLR